MATEMPGQAATEEGLAAFRVVHSGQFPSYNGARYREIIRNWLDDKDG